MKLLIFRSKEIVYYITQSGMVYFALGSSYSFVSFTGTRLSEALNTPGPLVKSVQTGDLLVVIGV